MCVLNRFEVSCDYTAREACDRRAKRNVLNNRYSKSCGIWFV